MALAVFCLITLFLVRGANVVFIKFAQDNRVSNMRQALVFLLFFSTFQAALLFLVPPYNMHAITFDFVFFPLGFAVFYSMSYLFLLLSMSIGSSSLTNTIQQFNPVVTIAYGLFFWGERLRFLQIIGLFLFLMSIIYMNKSTFSVGGVHRKPTAKWLIFTLLATMFTGIAVIFTKQSMRSFPSYGKEYLIFFNLFAVVFSSIAVGIFARKEFMTLFRDIKFLKNILLAALTLDISNYIFVLYVGKMQSASFLSLVSGISMISITAYSRVVLHERVSKRAALAILMCVISIVLLTVH